MRLTMVGVGVHSGGDGQLTFLASFLLCACSMFWRGAAMLSWAAARGVDELLRGQRCGGADEAKGCGFHCVL